MGYRIAAAKYRNFNHESRSLANRKCDGVQPTTWRVTQMMLERIITLASNRLVILRFTVWVSEPLGVSRMRTRTRYNVLSDRNLADD